MKSLSEPRVKFCWCCGNKLWGNTFKEKVVQGHPRVMHTRCAKLHSPEVTAQRTEKPKHLFEDSGVTAREEANGIHPGHTL